LRAKKQRRGKNQGLWGGGTQQEASVPCGKVPRVSKVLAWLFGLWKYLSRESFGRGWRGGEKIGPDLQVRSRNEKWFYKIEKEGGGRGEPNYALHHREENQRMIEMGNVGSGNPTLRSESNSRQKRGKKQKRQTGEKFSGGVRAALIGTKEEFRGGQTKKK